MVDLESTNQLIAAILGAFTILGAISAASIKAYKFLKGRRASAIQLGNVPIQTLVLQPMQRTNALWWHTGTQAGEDAMQIVGDLTVTNIYSGSTVITGARLRKLKHTAMVTVLDPRTGLHGTNVSLPPGTVTALRLIFWVSPPTLASGNPFKGDIAVIDQFGNEHWLKGLQFPYL